MTSTFNLLTDRAGSYSLPWLIELSNADASTILRYVGDTEDKTYDGNVYTATALEYKPSAEVLGFDGGATLSIYCGKDELLIDMIEANRSITLEVVGAILQGETITPVRVFTHTTGSVNWDKTKATFTYDKDDRLTMTFPSIRITRDIARCLP